MDFDPDHNSLNHRNAKKYNEDEDGGIDSPVDESLYSLFNLPKSATVEEIRDRYKSLAVSLHPDKVRDESHKETMAAKFAQVKRAYEILTDPSKRAIYDLFGEDGLKTKWDVGSKYKTEEELRNEYARLARAAKLHDAENIVRSQGELVCAVNATSLTIQDWTDISDRTRFTLTSRLLSMRGRAGGNVFGTVKHQFSPRLQLEATSGLLEPRTVVSKATFEVNEATRINDHPCQRLARRSPANDNRPTTSRPHPHRCNKLHHPTLTSPSALAVSLSSTGGLVTTVELSPAKLQAREQLSAEYGVRVGGKEGVLLSASAATGLNQGGLGMVVEVNGTAKLAEATTVRVGVGAALPGGISLKIYLNRLGQRIIIPIQLSREFDLNLALYTAVIPSISAVLVNQYILRPQRQKRAKGRIDALRERQSEMLEEDRKQAEHYIESIREQVKRKIETEKGSDGLIISEAHYGPAKSIDDKNKTIDVSAPLQLLVNSSQLVIPGGRSKAGLLGFYDPCLGERKSLQVKYTFRSRLHQVTVEDRAPVELPLRGLTRLSKANMHPPPSTGLLISSDIPRTKITLCCIIDRDKEWAVTDKILACEWDYGSNPEIEFAHNAGCLVDGYTTEEEIQRDGMHWTGPSQQTDRGPTYLTFAMQAQQATCTNVHIRTTADAHRIFHATLLGIYPSITRRLDIEERRLVKPGACFVWEERGPDAEATGMGIAQQIGVIDTAIDEPHSWTDGLRWGPSRVRDDFLFYHQRDTEADDEDRNEGGDGGRAPPAKWLKKFARSRRKSDSPHHHHHHQQQHHHSSPVSPRLAAPGAIDRTSDRENDRLIKQTYSVFATIPGGGRQQRKWHITAYFTQGTIEFLRTVDQIPELAPVHPPPGTYRSARATGAKKNHEHIPPPHGDYALGHHPRQLESQPLHWSPYLIPPAAVASTSSHRSPSTHDYPSPEPIRELPHPLSPIEVRPASGPHQHYPPPTPTSVRSSISPFTRSLPLPRQGTNPALEDVHLPPLSVSPFPYAQRNATDDKQLDALLRRFMIPGTRPNPNLNPDSDTDSDMQLQQ
ncbi:hypothetical protein RHS01_05219 [Rhizoctonia solani]|uniref:J domain-containing protein n=1 Tax=Rhizoctonia solani TaxID=456999 RepID=A0A8H7M1T9_9AGAM|nr:hypothetical protein RHS01_05219 [Rhizoctonia solani]